MESIKLFLCGDVMAGRGIDQILPHPSEPQLHESYIKSAKDYVLLAERASGPIPRSAGYEYIWGDALALLDEARPDVRIVNLETSVTASEDAWPGKGIHYRMHPANVPALTCAKLDCCVLANNHVLDWGYAGLAETLNALQAAGLYTAGAGRNLAEAAAAAIIGLRERGRVIILAAATRSSGVSGEWAATASRPGVFFVPHPSSEYADALARHAAAFKRPGDIVVVSIHWGANWGYGIARDERAFAHRLVEGGVDLVYGHSSHHAKGIEVYRERPILYGCGDFLNDYEGIPGYEEYRPDLALMYFPTLDQTGRLVELALVPTRIRHFRVERASEEGVVWLQAMLKREGEKFATGIERQGDRLVLRWR